jgi:excisionase family DNA binding protein
MTDAPDAAEPLTEEDVARSLGVSVAYLRGLLDAGRLPGVAADDGSRRVRASDLAAFYEAEREANHAALDALTARYRELGLN